MDTSFDRSLFSIHSIILVWLDIKGRDSKIYADEII
jgi:hypothetical protein